MNTHIYAYATTHSLALTFPPPHIPPHHSLLWRKQKKRVPSHSKSVLQISASAVPLNVWLPVRHPSVPVCGLEIQQDFFLVLSSRGRGSKQLGLLHALCCRSSKSHVVDAETRKSGRAGTIRIVICVAFLVSSNSPAKWNRVKKKMLVQ